jgi:hypothetical protein
MSMPRRTVKTLLVSVAAAIGVLALLAAGLVSYATTDKRDGFVLQNAELSAPGYLQRLASLNPDTQSRNGEEFPVYVHRLKRGSGTIFGYRAYSPGKFSAIDDETYRKITVWIAGAIPTSPIEIPVGDDARSRLVFSDGASAWSRSGCSGNGTSGTIRVQPHRGYFTITISADITPVGNAVVNRCVPERVDVTFKAKEMAFKDLTPWLGIEGQHPYHETYRPIWPNQALQLTPGRCTIPLYVTTATLRAAIRAPARRSRV